MKRHIKKFHDGIPPPGSSSLSNAKTKNEPEDDVSFESSSAIFSDEEESFQHEVLETTGFKCGCYNENTKNLGGGRI